MEEIDPISASEIRGRQQIARDRAAAAGYDALLVVGRSFYDRPGDLAYLSGISLRSRPPCFPREIGAWGTPCSFYQSLANRCC